VNRDYLPIWIVGAVLGTFLGLILWAAFVDQRNWDAYAISHHCHPVGTKMGESSTGLDSNGRMVTSSSANQTIYNCDQGEIDIR
jgi:hypothetical protein